jgi:hypothetical protein
MRFFVKDYLLLGAGFMQIHPPRLKSKRQASKWIGASPEVTAGRRPRWICSPGIPTTTYGRDPPVSTGSLLRQALKS